MARVCQKMRDCGIIRYCTYSMFSNSNCKIFSCYKPHRWASKVLQQVEKKTLEMQVQKKSKESERGWFSYFFGSSKVEDEKKQISEDELQKLYSVLQAGVDQQPEADPSGPDLARTDEYYWLVGEFTLGRGVVKIQRDTFREKKNFKEAIVLTLEGINSKFMKRFKGLDLTAGVGNVVLSTYSSFGKKNKINNVVICKNPSAMRKEGEKCENDLAFIGIRMLPPNTDMQFELEATAKSLRIYYLPLLMGRMMMFLGQEEVRSTTYNALNEIKDNTQDTIQAALEGKKSRVLVAIESPVLIVPILKNNDPSSPVWCFKLGDIKITSKVICTNQQKQPNMTTLEGPVYDHFELTLDNIGLDVSYFYGIQQQFYKSLLSYEAYERQLEFKEEDHFVLINDFSVLVDMGILRGPKKSPEIASTKTNYVINSLQFRFNPLLYNYFVNITDAFSLNEDDEAWRELVRNKADIIEAQRMIGILKKRGEGLKKYWYKYYCCLSGGYLYFYEANRQPYPTTYFYLKNTEVTDGAQEIGIENTLILRNKTEQCYLAFNSEKDCKAWKAEIEAVIKEISFLSEAVYRKTTQPIDCFDVLNETKVLIKNLSVEILDEKGGDLVKGQIMDAEATGVKRPEDFTMNIKIRSFELFHPKNLHFKRILYNEEHDNLLSLSIELLTKNSPKYTGELLIVEAELGHIMVYYPPKLIKRLMQILLDIKPKQKPKFQEEEKKGEVLKRLMSFDEKEEPLEKVDTCKENKDILLKATAKLDNVNVYCLHSKYDTLLFLFSMETSIFEYASHSDHDDLHCNLGNSTLYDLTNYPNTILPLDFFDEKVKPQKLVQIQSSYYNDNNAFTVDMVSYQAYCPERPLTPENLMSKIQIKIGTIKVDFYNEYLAFRFTDYFLYQFLDSLSPRDSVAESLALYEKNKKSHEGMDLYDIMFFSPFSSIDLTIQQPLIYLKPRLHYKDYFMVDLGNVHIWNERQRVPGRWLKHKKEKTLCEIFHMDTTSLTVSYNEKHSILEPCHFFTQFELICIEAYDYNNHDPSVLDQSHHIKVVIPKILKLCMKPEHYTYLLKCLDLNVNYTDNNSDFFNFRQVNVNVIEGGIKYTLDCSLPSISFLTLNSDNSVLAEFVAKNIDVSWVTNNDFSKSISLGASHFYSLNAPSFDGRTKGIIMAPLMSSNEVTADDVFYTVEEERKIRMSKNISVLGPDNRKSVQIRLQILKNNDKIWNVNIVKHKMFLQLHLLMLLSHFFIEGFPNYKDSPEQPNECIFQYYLLNDINRHGGSGEIPEVNLQSGASRYHPSLAK
eukprot:TRINITY_DN1071_c0_g1_i1.p1 TRINITY_DN1071_c0_g1~~TRINITY_DN1071_c0_g1_i1.p1  ORF type:complete len:1296 (+),score=172.27 TRINITY_DN1071_c0_g1_i1:23862-27749(+)